MITGIAVGFILMTVGAAAKWLSVRPNREKAQRAVRERLCRHEWEPPSAKTSARFISIGPPYESCRKCGAERR